MDMSNKDAFRRFTFAATMDRNAAKDNSKPKKSKGRPHLVASDKLHVDLRVSRARKGVSSYDA